MLAGLALALKSDQGQGKSKGSSQAQGRLAPAVPSSVFLQQVLGASSKSESCSVMSYSLQLRGVLEFFRPEYWSG